MTTKESERGVDVSTKTAASGDLTDGFHLLIDALKLNDLNTI